MPRVKPPGRQLAACLVVISVAQCGQIQAPDPSIPSEQASCGYPVPPPLTAVSRSGDMVACLGEETRQRGLVVTMFVGRDGRATSAQQWAPLCAPVDPKRPGFSMEERACVVNTIRSWRFAAFDTCATQFAHIGIPAQGRQEQCGPRLDVFEVNLP